MKYIIMCGGNIEWKADKLRQLSVINGEVLLERTIRLLRENGVEDIAVSSLNPIFDNYGVPRLVHDNPYTNINSLKTSHNYWVDCFYPTDEPVCYICGDVYFDPNTIKTIVEFDAKENTFFGTRPPYDKRYFKPHDEPLAFKIVDQPKFREAINECKRLQDKKLIKRGLAISWHVYRIMDNIDVNVHQVGKNFVGIHDMSIDIDYPEDVERIERALNQ